MRRRLGACQIRKDQAGQANSRRISRCGQRRGDKGDDVIICTDEELVILINEKLPEAEYLASLHYPDKSGARDDTPNGAALALVATSNAEVGQIIIL